MDDLINKVYPHIHAVHNLSESDRRIYFSERAILAALNSDVDGLNDACLNRLSGDSMTYLSVDTALDEGGSPDYGLYPQEYLNTITLSGMPVHSITLKVGCPIILLRNLDPSVGLCNGTRLIVTALRTRVIEVKILSGSHAGDPAFIPRIALITASSSPLPFKLRRRQFPIRLAFGISINKSQGQSLRIIGIYLFTEVFAHGQLYVALSRAIDRKNVYISLSMMAISLSTINIVYKKILI
jgi:ATP-dependent DNA helicase PIF1